MTAEEVARLHQFRDGFSLVDYAEVGLPVFRLTIEAITTAQRSIPTIQEFVMRCFALGVEREEEVARMLGLKLDIVQAATNLLVSDSYAVRQAGQADLNNFRLTEAGETRLREEKLEVPQEEMLVIDYDGIRRLPIRLASANVERASELRSHGAIEIRPYPAEPPAISELSIPDVTRVIRRQSGEDFRRTVLALKRIVRRNNLFREAVALVFAADKGSEIQIAFAIDGKLSDLHERAFAENGGPRKMGFVKSIAEGATRRRLERVVGKDAIRAFPSPGRTGELRTEQLDAEVEVRSLLGAASAAGRNSPAAQALKVARERSSVAEHAIQSTPMRPLACYEQDMLLDEAVSNARRSLIITSAGLQPRIVNSYLLRAIDGLLAAGVVIRVESMLPPTTQPRKGDYFDPLAELGKRMDDKKLILAKAPRRDLYYLIQDDDLAVVTNRPFLGEVSRRTGFIRIEGLVTRDPQYVRMIRETLLASTESRRGKK